MGQGWGRVASSTWVDEWRGMQLQRPCLVQRQPLCLPPQPPPPHITPPTHTHIHHLPLVRTYPPQVSLQAGINNDSLAAFLARPRPPWAKVGLGFRV